MLLNIQNYFTLEMIYLWINYGVLPFWVILIFFPNLKINQILVTSIFLPIIFSCLYSYIVYQLIFNGENIFNSFEYGVLFYPPIRIDLNGVNFKT